MRRFLAATRADRIAIERRPRACAHGAELASLPEVSAGGVGVVERVGDVEPGQWVILETEADADDPRLEPRDALLGRFAAGELNAAPELMAALTAEPLGLDWHVAPGVRLGPFRTPTLLPATHTNSFLLTDGQGRARVLVEPAPSDPLEVDRLAAWAAGVESIFVTHHHPDHVGALQTLAARLRVPVLAHPSTASRCRGDFRHLEDGEILPVGERRWQALHTPGHAPGHLCLFDPDGGTAIVGDMVAGTGTILVEPGDGDMGQYLASLGRLAELNARKVLPAHGGLLVGGEVFTRTAAHRRMREEKVLAALERAPGPVMGLVPIAYDDAPRAVWPLARLSVEAHLLHLEAQGLAVQDPAGWRAV